MSDEPKEEAPPPFSCKFIRADDTDARNAILRRPPKTMRVMSRDGRIELLSLQVSMQARRLGMTGAMNSIAGCARWMSAAADKNLDAR